MHRGFLKHGLATAMLVGLVLSGADAAATRPISPQALGLDTPTTPIAMCGYSCRSGGRYIPGPPSVCYEAGLNFCGSLRGWGGPPPGRGFYGGGPYGVRPYGYGGPPRGAYGYGGGPYGRPQQQGRTWYGYGPGRCGWTLC